MAERWCPGGVLASSNLRGGDAAACLEGMNAALAASRQGGSTPRHQGKILARAPESVPVAAERAKDSGDASALAPLLPADALAVDMPVFQRWQSILKIVLGRGTGAPRQIGVILVSLDRTPLQRTKILHNFPKEGFRGLPQTQNSLTLLYNKAS